MRRFIRLKNNRMRHYFPKSGGIRMKMLPNGIGWSFYDAENCITAMWSGMQDGTISWLVIYSSVDSPIESRGGEFSLNGNWGVHDLLIDQYINAAIDELLYGWKSEFLPPNEKETAQ